MNSNDLRRKINENARNERELLLEDMKDTINAELREIVNEQLGEMVTDQMQRSMDSVNDNIKMCINDSATTINNQVEEQTHEIKSNITSTKQCFEEKIDLLAKTSDVESGQQRIIEELIRKTDKLEEQYKTIENVCNLALKQSDFNEWENGFTEIVKTIRDDRTVVNSIEVICTDQKRLFEEVITEQKSQGVQAKKNVDMLAKTFDLDERQNKIIEELTQKTLKLEERCETIVSTCNLMLKQSDFNEWKNGFTEIVKTIRDDSTVVNSISNVSEKLTAEISSQINPLKKRTVGLIIGNCVMFVVIVVMFIIMVLQ